MKFQVLLLALVAGLATQTSFAGGCPGDSLSGEIQIILLTGSSDVFGRVGNVKELMGVDMNPLKAEPQNDGSVNLNVYEAAVQTRLGQKIADLGKMKLVQKGSGCVLVWILKENLASYDVLMTSYNGDLILGSRVDGLDEERPNMIIRKITK